MQAHPLLLLRSLGRFLALVAPGAEGTMIAPSWSRDRSVTNPTRPLARKDQISYLHRCLVVATSGYLWNEVVVASGAFMDPRVRSAAPASSPTWGHPAPRGVGDDGPPSFPCGLGKIDQNVISLSLYRIGSHGKCARDNLTRCHVELVAMPRTSDHRSVDPSFSQWPAAMCADIVQGVEDTVDVEKSNRSPANANNLARAGRYLIDFSDLHHRIQRSSETQSSPTHPCSAGLRKTRLQRLYGAGLV